MLPRGAGWTALDPLPVECLGFDAEILDRLHQVNVRWVGELRRLPRTALPALAFAIAVLIVRVIGWSLWDGIEPQFRTVFMASVLILLGLALTGRAHSTAGAVN